MSKVKVAKKYLTANQAMVLLDVYKGTFLLQSSYWNGNS